jgi:hypothetical protein
MVSARAVRTWTVDEDPGIDADAGHLQGRHWAGDKAEEDGSSTDSLSNRKPLQPP